MRLFRAALWAELAPVPVLIVRDQAAAPGRSHQFAPPRKRIRAGSGQPSTSVPRLSWCYAPFLPDSHLRATCTTR